MKTLLLTILLCTTAHAADMDIQRVAPDAVIVSLSDVNNIAAYNFTLVGAEIVGAQYIGQADKTADFHGNNVIVYGLNAQEVGAGQNLLLKIKRLWKPTTIEIQNAASADMQANAVEVIARERKTTNTTMVTRKHGG